MVAVTQGLNSVLVALALVLVAAAVAKLRQPASRRARPLAALELATAGVALIAPAAVGGGLEALLFTSFAAQHMRAPQTDSCGCFGEKPGATGPRAVLLTAGAALLALLAAVDGSTRPLVHQAPERAIATLVAGAFAAGLWRAAFMHRPDPPVPTPARPASDREGLVNRTAWFLERRVSRRGALTRLAVAGSALAVAPLRYLLYPGTAMAVVVPGDCGSGLCTDGYTAFCCEINQGLNACPTGTYPGGWWQCQDYVGRQLCSNVGVRYYVDCNAIPGEPFPGGCRCANDSCDYRRVACNIFRYGQCNTQIAGTTAVVCRMVVCENPALIPQLNCSSSLAIDNAVCGHDVPCLEPPAVELAGAGGV